MSKSNCVFSYHFYAFCAKYLFIKVNQTQSMQEITRKWCIKLNTKLQFFSRIKHMFHTLMWFVKTKCMAMCPYPSGFLHCWESNLLGYGLIYSIYPLWTINVTTKQNKCGYYVVDVIHIFNIEHRHNNAYRVKIRIQQPYMVKKFSIEEDVNNVEQGK